MNLLNYLKKDSIESLGYESIYLEKPLSNLVDFDWKTILPAPPSNIDSITIKELNLLSKKTLNRSKKDIDLIYAIDKDIDQFFISILNQYNLLYPQKYIDLFYEIVHPILLNTKAYWNRPRPSQLSKLLNIKIDTIITDTIHTASYPSGHTVYSSIVAHILKEYYPQINQKQLDSVVLKTAEARVLQGVHYPSDNKASLIFSDIIFKKLYPKLRKYKNDQI